MPHNKHDTFSSDYEEEEDSAMSSEEDEGWNPRSPEDINDLMAAAMSERKSQIRVCFTR